MSGIYENPMDREDDPRDADDRLRGEAAQGEQQALFGYFYKGRMVAPEDASDWLLEHGRALYTRPQPVAVAGDAAKHVPPEWISEPLGGHFDDMTPGQAWRSGFNECRMRTLRLIERAALSAAPAAPETDAVLIGQAVCYGGDSDGGGDWFKELTVEGVTFLAPLDDHQRAIHILAAKKRRKQEAAPAPVAGDAVALPSIVREVLEWYASDPSLWVAWNEEGWAAEKAAKASGHYTFVGEDRSGHNEYVPNSVRAEEALAALDEWLAQDRASQAGAAGLPVLHKWQIDSLRYGLRLSPETHADDQIELALSAALLAAAPTPAAEGEVRNVR